MWIFSQQLTLHTVLFPRIFSIYYEHLFSETPIMVWYLFFPWLRCVKLELGIFVTISDVSLKFFPAFQNIETTLKKCLTEGAVQQNDKMKYNHQWL